MMIFRKLGLISFFLFLTLVVVVSTGFKSGLNREAGAKGYKLWTLGNAVAGSESDLFQTGRTYVTRGWYQQAITTLDNYLADYPEGRYASRTQFFLAKAYLGLEDLEWAKAEFALTVRRFPSSLEAHKSRYKMALIALWQGNRVSALEQFQDLADQPDGPLAPEARIMAKYLAGQQI